MNRRNFLRNAGVGAASVAAATTVTAPAIAQSMPELKWRLTSSFPKSLDTLYGAAEHMTKVVAEATDNKFQIRVFAAGEIVPGLQVADAVQNGTVEMGHTASYYFFGKDPTFALATAVPFALNPRQQDAWLTQGGGEQLLNEFFKGYKIFAIANRCIHKGARGVEPARNRSPEPQQRMSASHPARLIWAAMISLCGAPVDTNTQAGAMPRTCCTIARRSGRLLM